MFTPTKVAAAILIAGLVATGCGGDDDSSSDTTAAAGGATTAVAQQATFEFVPLDSGGPLTKAALRQGDVQVALLFTSDADIADSNWVLLEDDEKLQPAENLIPAIRSDKVTPAIESALDAISDKLTTEELTTMNSKNSIDGDSPADVAKTWLGDNGLLPYKGDKVTGSLNIGSTNFAEQEIVAELYAQVLESAGASVSKKFQLGAREIVAPALAAGEIDLYPEYVGSYITFLDGNATVPTDSTEAAAALNKLLAGKGVEVLKPAEAEDKNGFVVTEETAKKYDLTTVSDLAAVTDALALGGPPECPQRPYCLIGLKDTYGLKFNV